MIRWLLRELLHNRRCPRCGETTYNHLNGTTTWRGDCLTPPRALGDDFTTLCPTCHGDPGWWPPCPTCQWTGKVA